MQIACVADLSLWSCFLEGSVEDMLLMACVDARTTNFYSRVLFLAVPFFSNRETSEKDLMERLFFCKTVVLQETDLAVGRWLACCFCFVSAS